MEKQKQEIDPLRRVFVPKEKQTTDGQLTFRTLDRQQYLRLEDGSIRRVDKKVNGREARRARARQRQLSGVKNA